MRERIFSNARDAAIGRNDTILASGNQDFRSSFHDAVSGTVVNRVFFGYGHAGQRAATREHSSFNARDAVRDRNARKAPAKGERIFSNAGDAVRDLDARKARAICERTISDARDAIGDFDVLKCRTTVERIPFNARDAARELDAYKTRERSERRTSNARNAIPGGRGKRNHDVRIGASANARDIASSVVIRSEGETLTPCNARSNYRNRLRWIA